MRRSIILISLFFFGTPFLHACAKPTHVRVEQRRSFAEVKTDHHHYARRAAMVQTSLEGMPFIRQAQESFLQQVTTTIQGEDENLKVLAPGMEGMPPFLRSGFPGEENDSLAMYRKAGAEGIQYLVYARVLNIDAEKRKTGIWWFRKERYFIHVDVAVDVFETITGAKLFSRVETDETKVDGIAYEEFRTGNAFELEDVNAIIAEMAGDLGKDAAEQMENSKWMALVTEVQGDQVVLAVGRSAGVQVGDRFAMVEGRRAISGPDGRKYIVPGYKIAEARITAVDPTRAIASTESQAAIRPGDIALPEK